MGLLSRKKSVGEAQPPEIAKHSATAIATTVAKSVCVGEARFSGTAIYEATTESELAEFPADSSDEGSSSDEDGPSWSRASGKVCG